MDFTHASHASMGKICKVKSMEKHGKAWDTDHGKPWNSMGKTCGKTMEKYMKTMEFHGKHWAVNNG